MEEQEYTLKQLLKSFKAIYWDAKKRIKVFFFILIVCSGIGLGYCFFFNQPKYDATITFMINETGGQGLNSILNFASQIGIGMPESEITGDKVQDLIQSQSIISASLLSKTSNNQLIANELIDSLHLQKRIKKYLKTDVDFRFKNDNLDNMDAKEIRVINWLCSTIREKFLNIKINKSEIIECAITTTNQLSSKILCEQLVSHASNFYINKKIEKNKVLYQLVQNRFDSLRQVLFDKEILFNKNIDATKLNIRQAGTFDQNVLKRELSILGIMYNETAQNLDKVKFEIESETPIFQLIDKPHLPLEPMQLKPVLMIFLTLFFSFLLFVGYLIIVKINTELHLSS